jgi:hypothetical protein
MADGTRKAIAAVKVGDQVADGRGSELAKVPVADLEVEQTIIVDWHDRPQEGFLSLARPASSWYFRLHAENPCGSSPARKPRGRLRRPWTRCTRATCSVPQPAPTSKSPQSAPGPSTSASTTSPSPTSTLTMYSQAPHVLVHNCGGPIRVSSSAQDWGTKGAHVHAGSHEVRIFLSESEVHAISTASAVHTSADAGEVHAVRRTFGAGRPVAGSSSLRIVTAVAVCRRSQAESGVFDRLGWVRGSCCSRPRRRRPSRARVTRRFLWQHTKQARTVASD